MPLCLPDVVPIACGIEPRGQVVRSIQTHELTANAGPVSGHIVCDGEEQTFSFNLPASRSSKPSVVDMYYKPQSQVVRQFATVKSRTTGQTADKVTYTTRSPVPDRLEVWLNGDAAFRCHTATWT